MNNDNEKELESEEPNYIDWVTNTKNKSSEERKEEAKSEPKEPTSDNMSLYDWLQSIVSAVVVGILIFVFIGRIDGIEGPSMMQTLQNGDSIILSNLFFSPQKGDIVFIKTAAYGDTPIVKRIIATEGQTVDIDFELGVVYVDGQPLEEDYVNTPTNRQEDFVGPKTVPEGHVFVMGDNRNESTDSRDNDVDMVDVRNILGKVYFVLIPGKGYGTARDWSRIGSVY